MIKNDIWIKTQASLGMIEPYESKLINKAGKSKLISYGLSSYGYDVRLSPDDFKIFRNVPGRVIDPKNFSSDLNLYPSELHHDETGSYFVIPGGSYALGVTHERISMPDNVTAVCIGKSTYCRCGLIVNVTPIESGWCGYITLEISNSSPTSCKVYANEGIAQLLFFEGEPCETNYRDRKGKYQDQKKEITIARV